MLFLCVFNRTWLQAESDAYFPLQINIWQCLGWVSLWSHSVTYSLWGGFVKACIWMFSFHKSHFPFSVLHSSGNYNNKSVYIRKFSFLPQFWCEVCSQVTLVIYLQITVGVGNRKGGALYTSYDCHGAVLHIIQANAVRNILRFHRSVILGASNNCPSLLESAKIIIHSSIDSKVFCKQSQWVYSCVTGDEMEINTR